MRADRPARAHRRGQPPRPRRRGARSLFPRPTPLPGDITDWLETFAQPFLGAVAEPDRRTFIQDVRAAVQPALFDPSRGWTADYMRLRFAAERRA